MATVRQPAVAGMFYPSDPTELRTMVDGYLSEAAEVARVPKAIIAPHAGFIYSGPIAASAYTAIAAARHQIKRVVLLGPAHRVGFHGLAASHADFFRTPLGDVSIDKAALEKIIELPQLHWLDEAHTLEHSLEVQLPFLQRLLDDFTLIPLVVGDCAATEVEQVLKLLWGGDETLIVISSDLSHYHDYLTAQQMDRTTSNAIEQLDGRAIHYESACGRNGILGLLAAVEKHQMTIRTIDLRNSGDTAGARDQVVGYGAYLVE
ncbi:AmmeMemoRadiSam system protein B [Solemya pervernicosa gill symbiont]|uniref:MEMO1 family protein BOW53_00810 n=2 Tax=Gammaproteobacteria incertae sedis TaxID=118884 RepID=A0A1T2LAN2_9GAMM|nr:AmmeMemoRadiSam system protein B [Candidatus Reidiella endopervernicosa]OOZ42151.1 AmmeMemoRadiSam system protein B [Solemya pervernicosa gill symbiont]QKQ27284.1 AmmeMemoRadiSam system protein B [Candidatus Reidiella endopervernicosa]